jgi:hypothetical protein
MLLVLAGILCVLARADLDALLDSQERLGNELKTLGEDFVSY